MEVRPCTNPGWWRFEPASCEWETSQVKNGLYLSSLEHQVICIYIYTNTVSIHISTDKYNTYKYILKYCIHIDMIVSHQTVRGHLKPTNTNLTFIFKPGPSHVWRTERCWSQEKDTPSISTMQASLTSVDIQRNIRDDSLVGGWTNPSEIYTPEIQHSS